MKWLFKMAIFAIWSCPIFCELPDFIIIGAQKGGTTSLFSYIAEHPNVATKVKEMHFFDVHYKKGIEWYKTRFPSKTNKKFLVGEATPSYLFHTDVPRKVARHCPNVKLIILLRNPIERAFSAYKMHVRANREKRSLEKVIQDELLFLKSGDPSIKKEALESDYILSRGVYLPQIQRWMRFFKKEQILIIRSEDFFQNVQKTMKLIYKFLQIPNHALGTYKIRNKSKSKTKMPEETKRLLKQFYKPYNEALQNYLTNELKLDIRLNWDR